MKNTKFPYIAIISAPFIIVGVLVLASPWTLNFIEWSYNSSVRDFNDAAVDSLPYIYVGALGIMVAGIGIAVTAVAALATMRKASQERKQQDTQKTLLDTRLSSLYQEKVALRWSEFETGKDGNNKKARANHRKFTKNKKSPESAAVIYLLNYCEFLAIGIFLNNLDEDVLYESLRGIVCRLLFDMRMIISEERNTDGHERSCQYLVVLYYKWVKKKNADEWKQEMDLGPYPDHVISKFPNLAIHLPSKTNPVWSSE